MIISILINDKTYKIDAALPIDISIPLKFNGAQPNAYGVEKAVSKACEAGSIIGDTRRGGSVNFEQYTLIPHCNGTHTECAGHITHARIPVHNSLKDAFVPASLISVSPEKAADSGESYTVGLHPDDLLVTREAIEKALDNFKFQISNFKSDAIPTALIIRTLPNDESKLARTYLKEIPPFFSTEAIQFISEIGVTHLLVDMPSIDRIFDEGKLSNHRAFWNVAPGAFEISESGFVNKTVTELIYVADEIADGNYLLNLQIAPFMADASPSRPVIFAIQ